MDYHINDKAWTAELTTEYGATEHRLQNQQNENGLQHQ